MSIDTIQALFEYQGTYGHGRARKIKCDEGRPVCKRCASTGRTCEGYGIWGGGGNGYDYGSSSYQDHAHSKGLIPCPKQAISTEENGFFEWFKCRTAIKLPSLFVSAFWDTLVFQASVDEPAVLHAVLALGAVHNSEILQGDCLGSRDSYVNKQEKFMLQHYSEAINCLQSRCSVRNKASIRVALVACVMFVCLELLRGHYQTALTHLGNGMKLLSEIRDRPEVAGNQTLTTRLSCDPMDDHITEALSSLSTQAALLDLVEQDSYLRLEAVTTELSCRTFSSLKQAKLHLYQLLKAILDLKAHCDQEDLLQPATRFSTQISHQQRLLSELSSWLNNFIASKAILTARNRVPDLFAYTLLLNHHTMAGIMASTCFPCNLSNESCFDAHTVDFISIITRSLTLWKIIVTTRIRQSLSRRPLEGHHEGESIVEIGWIPPLYYTAIKCRVHRIRLHAIRLLELSSHREGFWVASIMAAVARQVMTLEDDDTSAPTIDLENDNFDIWTVPGEQSRLRLPTVPEEQRVGEVKVVLPDDPAGKVTLICKQNKRAKTRACMIFQKELDVRSNNWKEII